MLRGQTVRTPQVGGQCSPPSGHGVYKLGLPQHIKLEGDASCPSCEQVLCGASPPALSWTGKCCQQEVMAALRCLLLRMYRQCRCEATAVLYLCVCTPGVGTALAALLTDNCCDRTPYPMLCDLRAKRPAAQAASLCGIVITHVDHVSELEG